jgi:hypothetical protein
MGSRSCESRQSQGLQEGKNGKLFLCRSSQCMAKNHTIYSPSFHSYSPPRQSLKNSGDSIPPRTTCVPKGAETESIHKRHARASHSLQTTNTNSCGSFLVIARISRRCYTHRQISTFFDPHSRLYVISSMAASMAPLCTSRSLDRTKRSC